MHPKSHGVLLELFLAIVFISSFQRLQMRRQRHLRIDRDRTPTRQPYENVRPTTASLFPFESRLRAEIAVLNHACNPNDAP